MKTNKDNPNKMGPLAEIIIKGEIDQSILICPFCGSIAILFSFTRKIPPRFGLFVECQKCGHREHFSLPEKPINFKEEFVLDEYQHLEDIVTEIVHGKDFKK